MAEKDNAIEEDEMDAVDYREEGDQEGGIFRWMSVFVVLLAVAGFFSLAWYAYKSGGEVTNEADAELIMADASPIKEAPTNPGGIVIPNQDKAVYGLVGSGKADENKGVEHILSSPETPVIHNEESDTGTWMSEEVKEKLKASEGEKSEGVESQATEDEASIPKKQEVKEASKEVVAKPEDEKVDIAQAALKPPVDIKELKLDEKGKAISSVEEKANAPDEQVKTVAKKPETTAIADSATAKQEAKTVQDKPKEASKETPNKEAVSSSATVTSARAQLGAFKSEAEAAGVWKKIEKKFSSEVAGKSHYIVRADLGAKGIFYRLQLTPFDGMKDAERFCLSLVSEGQGCMPVKGK